MKVEKKYVIRLDAEEAEKLDRILQALETGRVLQSEERIVLVRLRDRLASA